MLSTILSSFLPTAYADAPEDNASDQPEDKGKEDDLVKEQEDEAKEEESEDPEDIHPILREECAKSAACGGFKKHFEHCQEKVLAGEGYKGEDCVEEIMMHCADNCVAPRLFAKLK